MYKTQHFLPLLYLLKKLVGKYKTRILIQEKIVFKSLFLLKLFYNWIMKWQKDY